MKSFKPTRFDDSVNLSKEHPLKEFFVFFLKGLAALILIYAILGFVFESYLMRMSVQQEVWLLGKLAPIGAFSRPSDDPVDEKQAYLNELFDKIPADLKPEGYNYRILLMDNEDPNALTFPGGVIVVTSGLLDTLDSENAIVFILGHELGHIQNRDHLRGMGYGFAGVLVSILLSGQDQGITSISSGLYNMLNLGLSRQHEREADLAGLQALQGVYGHVGGATEFFEKLEKMENKYIKMIPSILSTHPGHQERIVTLQSYIKKHNMPERTVIPSRYHTIDPKAH